MKVTDELAELFERFPGIGPKQAKRFVYHILKSDAYYKERLATNILKLKNSSKKCDLCHRFFGSGRELNICEICSDNSRDINRILIVEKELDVDAIEKTGAYKGLYFVLGNMVNNFVDKPSEITNIKSLVEYIHNKISNEALNEIIFAFPANDDGDTTIKYLKKTLSQIVGIDKVKLTELARGLSTGLELEYVDKNTFAYAFNNRHEASE